MSAFVIHSIFAIGTLGILFGFVLNFIPLIAAYKLPIQIISILVFALGVYLQGVLATEKKWELKIKEAEAVAARAEAEAAKKNTELQSIINGNNNVIREKKEAIIKYIDRYTDRDVLKELVGPERIKIEKVIEYVENCPIPPELVNIHNEAASKSKIKEFKK